VIAVVAGSLPSFDAATARIVLPLSVATAGVLLGLWLLSDDPDYAVGRVLDSPEQELTWVGFATVVTVMCGSSLTLVTNIADLTRYTRSRRDMRIGLIGSTLAATTATTLIGGSYAVGSGETNPFVAASELTSNGAVLAVLLVAIVVQTFAANVTTLPRGGRLSARLERPRARPRPSRPPSSVSRPSSSRVPR
jgi:cytosine/uracil/thiamine/allantoin permease